MINKRKLLKTSERVQEHWRSWKVGRMYMKESKHRCQEFCFSLSSSSFIINSYLVWVFSLGFYEKKNS